MRGLLLIFVSIAIGCGGSSSETPPPLEPDPRNLYRGTGAPVFQSAPETQQKQTTAEPDSEENEGTSRAPRSTWGSGKGGASSSELK